MKKFLILVTLIVSAFMLFSCEPKGEESDAISFVVDGAEKNIAFESVINDEEILVPMTDAEAWLGSDFTCSEDTGVIKAKNEFYNIEMRLDFDVAISGKKDYFTLSVYPTVIDGEVYVPIVFCSENLGFKIAIEEETNTVLINKKQTTYDQPKYEQHEWAIKRAHQLSGFAFTPLKDIPSHNSSGHTVLKEGVEYKGILYSSTESNNKFITENVSFETFLSALANPDSVLYTKDLYGSNNASSYYGMVCNTLVRYCLGITPRYNTKSWFNIPGMQKVAGPSSYTVNDLELCDVFHFYSSGGHVAIVTGILRDEDGKILKVEISECIRTNCVSRWFTVSEFEAYRREYSLCRYENVEAIPEFDEEENAILYNSGIEKTSPKIAVDYGNKSNYFYGETTVISSFAEGENTVQIYRGEELIEEISVNGYTKSERILDGGYYTVRLKGTEYFTEFCVTNPEITHTVENGVITITASSGDAKSKLSHMEFRGDTVQNTILTEEEIATGVIVRQIPEGETYFKVSFRNEYGIWTHKSIKIYQE